MGRRQTLAKSAGALALAISLAGCSAFPGSTTASTSAPAAAATPQPVIDSPASRLEHISWNTAWAKTCGFFFDNAKLKDRYLAFEATAGTPPDQLTKMSASYDKLQSSIRAVGAEHTDQCTDSKLDRIRAAMARYLAGDFSPGEAV